MPKQKRREDIFNKMIRAGSRTYFINVRISSKGDKYLSLCESRKVDGEYQNNRIMVFGDHIPAFLQALKEAAPSLKE